MDIGVANLLYGCSLRGCRTSGVFNSPNTQAADVCPSDKWFCANYCVYIDIYIYKHRYMIYDDICVQYIQV